MTDFIAVIVLYKTKLNESVTFSTLTSSLKNINTSLDLIVYDNSPDLNHNLDFKSFKNWRIKYYPDPLNGGVSKAYNLAAKLAIELNKKWILLLDQDTNFPINSFEVYFDAIYHFPIYKIFTPLIISDSNKVISPGIFKFGRGFNGKVRKPGIYNFKNKSLINCGLCIELNSFWKVDGYNERIKIDFSDHDFIRRFKQICAEYFVLIDLKVVHQLSVNSHQTIEQDKIRFGYYMSGIKHMSANKYEYILFGIHGFLRAFKLSFYHRTSSFILHFFRILFKNA